MANDTESRETSDPWTTLLLRLDHRIPGLSRSTLLLTYGANFRHSVVPNGTLWYAESLGQCNTASGSWLIDLVLAAQLPIDELEGRRVQAVPAGVRGSHTGAGRQERKR